MGLLSWRRSARGSDRAPKAPEAPGPTAPSEGGGSPGAEAGPVIRAGDLTRVPDWATLPPMARVLPEMPFVVSRQFDDSLTSWQPPEQFLRPLGHSVSPTAPSGLVDGIMLLSPGPTGEPADETEPALSSPVGRPAGAAGGDQPLILATPPVTSPGDAGERRVVSSRSIPGPWDREPPGPSASRPEAPALPVAGRPAPAAGGSPVQRRPADGAPASTPAVDPPASDDAIATAEPSQPPSVRSGSEPETPDERPAPLSPDPRPATGPDGVDLVGSAPLGPAAPPLISPTPPVVRPGPTQAPPGRLVHAAIPPDLPLARLPSMALPHGAPAEQGGRDVVLRTIAGESGPSQFGPSGPATAPSVTETAGTVVPASDPGRGAEPAPASPGGPPPQPLSPQPAPSQPRATLQRVPDSQPSADEPLPVAPLVGATPPLAPETAPAAPAAADPQGRGGAGAEALPLAQPQRLEADPGQPTPSVRAEAHPAAAVPGPPESQSVADAMQPVEPVAPAETSEPAALTLPLPVAPVLGQAEPLARESMEPIASPDAIAAPPPSGAGSSPGPDAAEQELVVSRTPAVPRSGLGEPLSELPSTAISWDITTMSRAEQVRASRALIQQRMSSSGRSGRPIPPPPAPLPAAPAPRREAPGPARPDTVWAGMPLPRVSLAPLGPALSGVSPADLPPVGADEAPLLSTNPLVSREAASPGPSPTAGSGEGHQVRQLIGQQHGLDLTAVPVDRTPSGASGAERLQARAFTSDRGVVIPSGAGSLEGGPGQALLAHELTHVAQRIRLGPNLPEEFTPAGRVLEGEALAAETAVSGLALPTASYPGRTGDLRTVPLQPSVAPGRSVPAGTGAGTVSGPVANPALPLAAPAPGGPDLEALAVSILDKMSALSSQAPPVPTVFTPHQPPPIGPSWSAPGPPAGPAPVQRAEEPVVQTVDPGPGLQPPPAPPGVELSARPSDHDLNNLSRWLYPLIRYRLKGELREDRERAGLLTDHYSRW